MKAPWLAKSVVVGAECVVVRKQAALCARAAVAHGSRAEPHGEVCRDLAVLEATASRCRLVPDGAAPRRHRSLRAASMDVDAKRLFKAPLTAPSPQPSHTSIHTLTICLGGFCPRSEVDSRRGRGASGCHTFPTSHGAAKGRSWFRAAEVDRTPAPGGGGAGWRAWSASGRRVRHRGTAVRPRSSQCQSIELRRPFHPRSGLADISCSDLSASRTAL